MNHKRNGIIFLIVYLAYTSIYVARVNLSMAGPELIAANVLDTVQIGMLGSVFSTVFAIGRLLNGGLSDTRPPWTMITIGLVIAGISNILVGFFPPFMGIFVLWAVNAYAQSMLWSSVLCVVSSMYDEQKAKKKTSLMVTSVAAGNIVGILINTWLITNFGAEFAFVVPGAITILLGGAVALTIRKIPAVSGKSGKHLSMAGLLKNKDMRLMSIPALFHGVMKENISLWMTVYLVDKFAVDLTTSAGFVLFIPALGFVGRCLYPVCFKLCGERENVVSVFGFIACILFSIPIAAGGISPAVAVICLSVIYTAASIVNTSILSIYPIRFTKTGNVASVSGMMDFATYLGAGISSVIYGAAIKAFGYSSMFVSWAVISVVSIAALVGILKNEKKTAVCAEENE
ncbi:MAG: MFS transporter [Clostridia bacterium]|nr:MFS transporter [Clostridia bacterium]